MLSEWNKFVQKIFYEGKKSNPKYQFKDALKDASARKSEMGSSGSIASKPSKSRRSRSRRSAKRACMKQCSKMKGGRSRTRRRRGGRPLMPASYPDDANAP